MITNDFAAPQLIEKIRAAFPEDVAWIDERVRNQGFEPDENVYCWIELFSQRTTNALKEGDYRKAESHLKFMSGLLDTADESTTGCIDVCSVESLMWDMNEEQKAQGWLLIPQNLRNLYIETWDEWEFMGEHGYVD